MKLRQRHPESFRDPAGFLYYDDDERLLRQVNTSFAHSFDQFRRSGLMERLLRDGHLVAHAEVPLRLSLTTDAHAVLAPRILPLVTYPSEWCFEQLRLSALHTIAVCELALDHGMILRDARADNVQFDAGRPVFVDALSFGQYVPGTPWIAYRQFCEEFLGPLLLMANRGVDLGRMHGLFGSGIPLSVVAELLGWRAWWPAGNAIHIGWHARVADTGADAHIAKTHSLHLPERSLRRLLYHLRAVIEALSMQSRGSRWSDYPTKNRYTADEAQAKLAAVRSFVAQARSKSILDVGANTGFYSRALADDGVPLVVGIDSDATSVGVGFREACSRHASSVHSLVLDAEQLVHTGSAAGRAHSYLPERARTDTLLVLAAAHHLVIRHGIDYSKLFSAFAAAATNLIIEYVPPSDAQVTELLAVRTEPTHRLDLAYFVSAFSTHYSCVDKAEVTTNGREVFYLVKR